MRIGLVEELLVKYPSSAVNKIADLGYGEGALFAAALHGELSDLEKLSKRESNTRMPVNIRIWRKPLPKEFA
jgi:hypothetical protein